MEYSDLLKAYHRLLAVPRNQILNGERPNFVVPLYETKSLRILMICTGEDEYPVRIETEVSFPLQMPDLDSNQNANQDSVLNGVLQATLDEMIAHLEYLRKLTDAGFRLEIMGEEGVWIASFPLKEPPTKRLYSLLNPPEKRTHKNQS